MAKLDIPVKGSRDELTILPEEFDEHIQHVMSLADEYAFWGIDYFEPTTCLATLVRYSIPRSLVPQTYRNILWMH